MLYVCDNCGLLFSRASEQDRCPDCGKPMVRLANQVERHEFVSRLARMLQNGYSGEQRFPNLVETEISMLSSFAFKLPATALQIDSDMIVEILVEYGEGSANRDQLTANVWAKEDDGVTIRFLMPIRLPTKPNESRKEQVNRIFAALNGNTTFKTKLFYFVVNQLQHDI